MLISALSMQATDLQSPNLHRGCIWRVQQLPAYLFWVTGVKMDKKHFGTTRVTQIVTDVHRDL